MTPPPIHASTARVDPAFRGPAVEEYDVFLFDLDGTLAPEGHPAEPECVRAIARLLERGKHVGIVTARGPAELAESAASIACGLPEAASGQLRYFASSASVVLRPVDAHGTLGPDVFSPAATDDAPTRAIAAKLARLSGVRVLDRGPQQTIVCSTDAAAFRVRKVLGIHASEIRALFVSPRHVHLLPKDGGKHRAVDYYAETLNLTRSVALGDGFYEVPEIDVRGNDMDFVGAATTCIQIGRLHPRDETVLFLPLGGDGPSSVRLVLGVMEELSAADLGSHPVACRPETEELDLALEERNTPGVARAFVSKLVDYLGTALEPSDVAARETAAARELREGGTLSAVAERLARGSPLEAGFARWAGFEGRLDWALLWLWDEHRARPSVPFTRLFHDRVRVPLLPEELSVSLLRALPAVNAGRRVVFVGKDAECALPLFERLTRALHARGGLRVPRVPPLGIKVSARKSRRRAAIDGAEHLELGSVARQLLAFLDDDERRRPVSPEVRTRAVLAHRNLPSREARVVSDAFEGATERYLETAPLEEAVRRLADLETSRELEAYVALVRGVVYRLQHHSLSRARGGGVASVESLLSTYLPDGDVDIDALVARYETRFAHSLVRTAAELRALTELLSELIGERYAALHDLELPYTPVLRALMSGARIRERLGPRPLFVDASSNSGTTLLFLRALGRIIAPEAEFGFAALGGVVLSSAIERDLEWHGHSHLPVLLEEGAPGTFDFFYDEDDERVTYAASLEKLGEPTPLDAPSNDHVEHLCAALGSSYARFPELAAAGVPFSDIVRWWLRRDRLWEMRVLVDRVRFRWPHAGTVQLQQSAIALLRELDAHVNAWTRAHLSEVDAPLRRAETRRLLLDWLAQHGDFTGRAFAFCDQLAERAERIAEYVDAPSIAAWRVLQRSLMAELAPARWPADERDPGGSAT